MRSTILHYWAKLTLWLWGWKIYGSLPQGVNKCVLVIAPHTSMRDYIIGRFAFWYLRIKVNILIKKESFKPPMGWFIKMSGGIPVDREHGSSVGNMILHKIQNAERICLVVTPEGTRKAVTKWKKGFYFLAHKARIPIVMGFIDYKKKEGGIGPMIVPTGDIVKDFEEMKEFIITITPLHPEQFSLPDWH